MDAFTFAQLAGALAFFAVAIALAVVIVRFSMPEGGRDKLGDVARWLAWATALACTVGSLILSEVYHLNPCRFCWFQRIAMYPMVVVLLVGAIRRDVAVRLYALPLALIGGAISIWHIIVQNVPGLEGGACDPNNPCSAKLVEVYGFVSIPVMAFAGFLLVSVLLAFFGGRQVSESS